jgi:23S rRNA (pseudouridine1915-N3)-methyltransferase
LRLTVVAVGRFGAGRGVAERTLFDDYVKRLSQPFELKEVTEKRPLPAAQLRQREGTLLLARVPEGAEVVALDAGGRVLSSAALAKRLGKWQATGIRDLAFIIGGAEGLDTAVLERADLVLSLGAMTWPHLLVRVLLAEQLYRAQCILTGHPYHRR